MKILIAGDFCPIGRIDRMLQEKRFAELFNGFQEITSVVDFAVVNLEIPVTTSDCKLDKTGPNLKTDNLNTFAALKYAGFDLLTLANNHIQDFGSIGVNDTIKYATDFNFSTVGAGKNITEAKKPFIKEIGGNKVGFINIAENEFCAATETSAGANPLDIIENSKEIRNLKNKVDYLILIYHGGREHYQLPTPLQRKRLRFFIDCGADAIVCHHTHCYSGFEYYKNKPIVYSVGNFIFDYKSKYQAGKWTEGAAAVLHLENGCFNVKLLPYYQGRKKDPTLKLMTGTDELSFQNRIVELNKIIADDQLFHDTWKSYILTQEKFYLASLYVKNFYVRALFSKGLLPISILKSKHNRLLLNLSRCETHREISHNILELNTEIVPQ